MTTALPAGLPAMFETFDITIQDSGERPLRSISQKAGDGGVPTETLTLVQYLYDNGQKLTLSFKGGKPYFGLMGESAAKAFVNDAKDSAQHVSARKEHVNGVSVTTTQDGIVVTVTVGKKRGRTPLDKTDGNATK
jgi:hypothetical protein